MSNNLLDIIDEQPKDEQYWPRFSPKNYIFTSDELHQLADEVRAYRNVHSFAIGVYTYQRRLQEKEEWVQWAANGSCTGRVFTSILEIEAWIKEQSK